MECCCRSSGRGRGQVVCKYISSKKRPAAAAACLRLYDRYIAFSSFNDRFDRQEKTRQKTC